MNNMFIDSSDRSAKLDGIINRVIKCQSCFKCCKNSSAFVLSHEVEGLLRLDVPLHEVNGVNFITPNADGCCPKLNKYNKCEIYENRPIACRIFPFYLMNRRDYPRQWVLFQFCPIDNWLLPTTKGRPSPTLLRLMAFDIEKLFAIEEIVEMANADNSISKRDRLEVGFNVLHRIMATQKC